MLNATTVNYSQGGLYDTFEAEFDRLNFSTKSFSSVLILGFGVGSVASLILEKYKIDCTITGVEKDPKVIELGYSYFNLHRFKKVKLFCDDAFLFVQQNTDKYNLIVVDIYLDDTVPENCQTSEFLQWLKYSLYDEGMIVFNKYTNSDESKKSATLLAENFDDVFKHFEVHEINKAGNNKMFVVR